MSRGLIARSVSQSAAREIFQNFRAQGEENLRACKKNFNFFLSGDFSPSTERDDAIIFCLTSLFIDSIHSNSCNKSPLQQSMKNGKGE